MKGWFQNAFIVFILVAILGLSVEMVSFRYWVTARQDTVELHEDMSSRSLGVVEDIHLAGLPGPVQRWLREAGTVGQPQAYAARTRMEFSMAWEQRDRWRDGVVHLYVNTLEPGSVWMGTSKEIPFVRLSGKSLVLVDREEETHPLLSMGRARILQGEMVRERILLQYLSHLPWIPTAAVREYLYWEGLGENQAAVSMKRNGVSVEGVFTFRDDGLPAAFDAQLPVYNNEEYGYRMLRVSYDEYFPMAGIPMPLQMDLFWVEDGAETPWMSLRHTYSDYNVTTLFRSF